MKQHKKYFSNKDQCFRPLILPDRLGIRQDMEYWQNAHMGGMGVQNPPYPGNILNFRFGNSYLTAMEVQRMHERIMYEQSIFGYAGGVRSPSPLLRGRGDSDSLSNSRQEDTALSSRLLLEVRRRREGDDMGGADSERDNSV